MTRPNSTSLSERVRAQIKANGPITFRDWMDAALYDESGGYYARTDLTRWGPSGDYRTAPERSPLFAAAFARYLAGLYQELGSPSTWTILEAGAGAGDFAYGVLNCFRRTHPQILTATKYVIDERTADGLERAAKRLHEFAHSIQFTSINDMNRGGSGIVFANELLDAFPVHRVTVRNDGLRELYVDLDNEEQFAWVEGEPRTPELKAYLDRVGVRLAEGQIAEINLEVQAWLRRAASIFERGYLIIVDYGAEANDLYGAPHRREGTLRAFHRHTFAEDPLAHIGEQDLTTTVDWTNVRMIGEKLGLRTLSFERLDEFLLRSGLLNELERMTSADESEADATVLRSGVRDLILPGGMSESFQVMIQGW